MVTVLTPLAGALAKVRLPAFRSEVQEISVPSTASTSSISPSTRWNTLSSPSGENCCRRFPLSLFTLSSSVPPPEGAVAVATMGTYPSTGSACPSPSQQ